MRKVPDRFELAGFNKKFMRSGRSIMALYIVGKGKKFRGF